MKPATPKRLLIVVTNISQDGGAEIQTLQLAVGLRRAGWEVALVALLRPAVMPAAFAAEGIPFHSLNVRRGLSALLAPLRLARLVRAWRPQVVHAHMVHANLLCRIVRLLAPMPKLVCTLHGTRMYNIDGTGFTLREQAHRITDRLADLTTVVCHGAAVEYASRGVVSAARLRVVPNGVDADVFRPGANSRSDLRSRLGIGEEFLWLSAGRLNGVKAYDNLLRAFHLVRNTHPDAHLAIAGDGDLREPLTGLSRALGLAERVHFLGQCQDLAGWMNAADAFVLASHFEGLALVLLEASACELPIVATRVGGNPEVVDEPRSGLLVEPRQVEALAGAMRRMMAMPDAERAGMGRAGRRGVLARYSLPAVLAHWESLYQELMTENYGQ